VDDAAEYLKKSGAAALGICCDVCDKKQGMEAVEQAVKTFGGVDILVNNAAVLNRRGVLDMTPRNGGSKSTSSSPDISTGGHQGEPRNVAYSTAKWG
jgi:NAD(P)-dependent dehydrogenase (short-subunit alcohol dehydrogenase family)